MKDYAKNRYPVRRVFLGSDGKIFVAVCCITIIMAFTMLILELTQ